VRPGTTTALERLSMVCIGLQYSRKSTVQDSACVYYYYVFSLGFCITAARKITKVKHLICLSLDFPKFSVFRILSFDILLR